MYIYYQLLFLTRSANVDRYSERKPSVVRVCGGEAEILLINAVTDVSCVCV